MEKNYFVYILYSSNQDLYYKGSTSNIEHRLREHNDNKSRYTAGKGPWKLVYLNEMESKREALIEEKRLKRLNKRSIEKLIVG